MKSNTILLSVLVGLLLIGGIAYYVSTSEQLPPQTTQPNPVTEEQQKTGMMVEENTAETATDVAPTTSNETESNTVAQYVEYSQSAVATALAENKKVVLFFHADWCPTCKAASIDITNNISELSTDLVIFKVDYDTNSELKQKYAVTYQHTFVQIDQELEAITTWNGGAATEIENRIKGS